MGWQAVLGVASALVYLSSTAPYLRALARRAIRPNLVAWGGGAIVNVIAFVAQITNEMSWSVVIAGVTALYCATVVALTWRNGDRHLTGLDLVCLSLGAIAIVAWQLSDNAEAALILSIAADIVLNAPMLEKTRRFPASEIPAPFFLAAFAAALSAGSAGRFDAVSLTWPIWLFVINATIGVFAARTPRATV
jgi:hypothetical protein